MLTPVDGLDLASRYKTVPAYADFCGQSSYFWRKACPCGISRGDLPRRRTYIAPTMFVARNMESLRILVTGGSGFIGSHLARELSSRGHDILACDLLNSERDRFIRCDVRQIRQVERLFERRGFDLVYHLAAEYGRWNGEDYYENLWETNAIGTKNIIRMQERLKFRLVFFSSAEVYGDYRRSMTEEVMQKVAIRQLNDYAITKWVGELMCLNSAEQFGTETVRVRPVNCYGPGEHYTPYRGFIPKFIFHALHNKPFIVHKGHKRIADYVEDSCRTFANVADHFVPGEVYNVGGRPEWERDIEAYSDLILKMIGCDPSLVTYQDPEPFTTKTKPIDCSKAIRDLKHDPKIAPEEGIKRTIEWMRSQYEVAN
jgi:dTDP-glucose 4,6-dehydratase